MTVFQPPRSPEIKSTRLVASQDEFRHVLMTESGVIETHTINKKNDEDHGRVIRTELPDDVKAALAIDDPVELICLGVRNNLADARRGRAEFTSPDRLRPGKTQCKLCLYSRKDVFVIDIEFDTSSQEGSPQWNDGTILRVLEPLEPVTAASGSEIVRIRAPSKSNQTLVAPSGCFAALIRDGNECYHMYLYHHKSTTDRAAALTSQFTAMIEAVPQEQIVDFCFAESVGLSLFSSLTILLLKESGDILAASPFVFEGSIVSKARLNQSLAFLRENGGRSDTKVRQCKAAERFLTDTFVFDDTEGRFATARVINQPLGLPSHWPVAHGTVFYQSSLDENRSQSIESIGRFDNLVGIAVGKEDCQVDYIAISPSSLLPRFELESREDSNIIDDEIMKASRCVEKICLGVETKEIWTIVKDRIIDDLLHCVTDSGVYTISSSALQECDDLLKGRTRNMTAASAWTTLKASCRVLGVGLNDDLAAGHEMIVHLENGTAVVDITDAKNRHDFRKFFEPEDIELTTTALLSNESSDPALLDVIEPLLKKINDGLASMAMVSGSETPYTEVRPEEVACVVAIKRQCDDELIMPIEELKKVVLSCQVTLRGRLVEQQRQLESIKKQVEELRSKIATNADAIESAKTLAVSQLERGKALLDISKQLIPKMTDAEIDFARDVQRYQRKCLALEKQTKRVVDKTVTIASSEGGISECGLVSLNIDQTNKEHLQTLVTAIGSELKIAKTRREKVEFTHFQMLP